VSAGADEGKLTAAARLAALRQAGLSAAADEAMDRFARLVASMLRVPVALVSLVEADRQVFPGMVGLAEPWATRRQTPLSHSLCQHVAASGSPLVLPDARLDKRTCASLAIPDLGVVAYAGMPLTDDQGQVLGSLCAIDGRPRDWSPQELADLADLAAACNGELRLRIMSRRAQRAREDAERADAEAQAYAAQARQALGRAQLMLQAAEDLADTAGLAEVRRRIGTLVSSDLKPAYVGIVLRDGQQLHRIPDPEVSHPAEVSNLAFPLDRPSPSARATRTGEIVVVGGPAAVEAEYGPATGAEYAATGLRTTVCVPLPGTRQVLGALILGWKTQHLVDVTERAVLTAIAGYTARAIERAQHLDERVTVARQLQQAMLTDLPEIPGLQLAAAYQAAAAGELVGGDWYDAYPLAGRDAGGRPGHRSVATPLAVTVGDISGHDMQAAAVMGQVRSMLRQADLSGVRGPADAVSAVERACKGLSLDATGTLVHGRLAPAGVNGAWQLTWTNAGHLPPMLARGGQARQLGQHDLLLWPGTLAGQRRDWQLTLVPGDTLLLYTDGLVERRDHDLDTAIGQVEKRLAASPAGQPLPDLLSWLIDAMPDSAFDDVALLAVRIAGTEPQ
jgi:serine phosphatase RsbU (regulator of sigma subunit)